MSLSVEVLNAKLLKEILQKLDNIEKLLAVNYSHPRGSTLSSVLHLKVNDQPTRIDFLDASGHRNIPINADSGGRDVIRILQCPVTKVIIFNMGPGGVHYDTNRSFNELALDTPVSANSSWEITSAEWPCIFALNIAAAENDTKVRVTAIV